MKSPRWHHRTLILLLACLLTASVFAATQKKLPHWQNPKYIEHAFLDIAMRGEYEQVRPLIRKWHQPLRVWVNSTSGDAEEQRWLIAMHFHHLSEITNLPVHFVPNKEQANVKIFFSGDEDLYPTVARELSPERLNYMDDAVCMGSIRFNRWSEITGGTVVIPVERAQSKGRFVPCIVEELSQMLGLINDSHFAYPTVFSDRTSDEFLTGLDYVLLRLLYLPEVHAGMTLQKAMPILRERLRVWERNGTIAQAQKSIQRGRLYALLNESSELVTQ